MKRILLMGTILCLFLVIVLGCGSLGGNAGNGINLYSNEIGLTYESAAAPNELMGNASADTSAFIFYAFDGETVLNKIIFQSAYHRQGIIDELLNVPAARVTGWTLDDITLPVYGIEMGTTCGHGVRAAWSNGFWITQTGDVYRFDFDFDAFIERQLWENGRGEINFSEFPNAIFLTSDEEGWHGTLLTPAAELNPPEGIEMSFVSNTNKDVTFALTNNNDAEWVYGVAFRIDVLLDGVWYGVPPMPGNWAFTMEGLILESGQTETKTYGFTMYGELPAGTYRLVIHDMYVVFEID